jgi:hypothetical protein
VTLGFSLTIRQPNGTRALEEFWALNGGGGFIRRDLQGFTRFWDDSTPMRPGLPPTCPV